SSVEIGDRAFEIRLRLELDRLAVLRLNPAQAHGGECSRDVGARLDLVERDHLVSGADLARVDGVVTESMVGDRAVLVAEEPIAKDLLGVELDLDASVACDGLERSGQVLDEDSARLFDPIDIDRLAVSSIREAFEERVVVVPHADADRREIDALPPVLGDSLEHLIGDRHAGVRDAVGEEEHAVRAVRESALRRHRVSGPKARVDVRAVVRLQPGDRVENALLLVGRRRLEDDVRLAIERHDADGVAFAKLGDEKPKPILDELETILLAHGARRVDDEDERRGLSLRLLDVARAHADREELVGRLVREDARPEIRLDAEIASFLGWREAVVETVDELLRADRLRRGKNATLEEI